MRPLLVIKRVLSCILTIVLFILIIQLFRRQSIPKSIPWEAQSPAQSIVQKHAGEHSGDDDNTGPRSSIDVRKPYGEKQKVQTHSNDRKKNVIVRKTVDDNQEKPRSDDVGVANTRQNDVIGRRASDTDGEKENVIRKVDDEDGNVVETKRDANSFEGKDDEDDVERKREQEDLEKQRDDDNLEIKNEERDGDRQSDQENLERKSDKNEDDNVERRNNEDNVERKSDEIEDESENVDRGSRMGNIKVEMIARRHTISPRDQRRVRQIKQARKNVDVGGEEEGVEEEEEGGNAHPVDEIWPKGLQKNRYKFCLFNNQGKLGNQIYEYASTYGIARNKGLTPLIDNDIYTLLRKLFNLTISKDLLVDANTHCARFGNTRHDQENARLARPTIDVIVKPPERDFKLQGFNQAWMYFYNYQDEIRREFRLRDDLRQEAWNIIEKASEKLRSTTYNGKNVIYIGVHLRRNLDFKGYKEYGIIMAPAEYYKRAMRYFVQRYRHVIFVVCSNGINFAKANLNTFPAVFIDPDANRPELDLCILALCQHSIISPGTYSFWSAFLANGETIYFRKPFAQGSRYAEKYSEHLSDYYLPYWMPME